MVALEARVLAKNDALAVKNRAWLAGRDILALNLVSSPGAGKTTLLERTIRDLRDELPLFVVEGDQATANDGERIRAAGAPVVQVNTGTGCHLEADMVARGLKVLTVLGAHRRRAWRLVRLAAGAARVGTRGRAGLNPLSSPFGEMLFIEQDAEEPGIGAEILRLG
ncbi:MAG: GTP-binding protein [Methyloceanibacter sp.]